MDAIVIGAGLSGLAHAHRLKKAGKSFVVLEASPRSGGVVRSERDGEFLLEFGPNTVPMKPELHELIHDLGLSQQIELADFRSARYVLFNGALRRVPMSIGGFIGTSLLSFSGKMSVISGLLFGPRRKSDEESLHGYIRNRFGTEAADRLAAPFVSGIWAGDAEKLSALSAFPSASPSKKKFRRGLVSFKDGLETLTRALTDSLAPDIKTGISVERIRRDGNIWTVQGGGFLGTADRVYLCTPAPVTAKIISALAPEVSRMLESIPHAPLSVLHLGFTEDQIGKPRKGFGFLTTPAEKPNILGCLWSSNLFRGRAPKNSVLWTVFMGGETNRPILHLTDRQLIERALETLAPVMKLPGKPTFTRVTRYERAIPQYTIGHATRLRVLEEAEKAHPGLIFAGSYKGGISVGDIIANAKAHFGPATLSI